MKNFIAMLEYTRPEGSESQIAFCDRFLKPVFGNPDKHGNYIKHVGTSAVAFMAHHDTVHNAGGKQIVEIVKDVAQVPQGSKSNCLGADCTSGIWLILEMIRANKSGTYVIHAGEEIGCVGARGIVTDSPDWLNGIDAAISFDRRGFDSIVTHQMGLRTSSDSFAVSLATVLGLNMSPDDSGSYTDSNEYAGIVPECTNISIGYFGQHSARETQDLRFLAVLRDSLIAADFEQLTIDRNPLDFPAMDYGESLEDLIYDYPDRIADILAGFGYTHATLLDEIKYYGDSDVWEDYG